MKIPSFMNLVNNTTGGSNQHSVNTELGKRIEGCIVMSKDVLGEEEQDDTLRFRDHELYLESLRQKVFSVVEEE